MSNQNLYRGDILTYVENSLEFEKYDKKLTYNMTLDLLKEAVMANRARSGEAQIRHLQNAIYLCEDEGLGEDPMVDEARDFYLPRFTARNRFLDALRKEDRQMIETCLREVEDTPLEQFLLVEIKQAKVVLEYLDKLDARQRQNQRKNTEMVLSGKALGELRRYRKPPPLLLRIVKATLLLLGEIEDKTDDWKQCQKICTPTGPNSLNRRLADFEPENAHEEIVARVKEMLSKSRDDVPRPDIDIETVEKVGAGTALAFYVWAMTATKRSTEIRRTNLERRGFYYEDKIRPADRRRQRELKATGFVTPIPSYRSY